MGAYRIEQITLLDPIRRQRMQTDISMEDGRIRGLGAPPSAGEQVIDGRGLYATCGWIDAHVHTYPHPKTLGVDPMSMLKDGVTAVVDAGTAGPGNFQDFYQNWLQKSPLRQKAYLNLAYMGISEGTVELQDLSTVSLEACRETAAAYPEVILGFKLRIDPRVCHEPEKALALARKLGDETGKPFVVHASRSTLPIDTILSYMRTGDIYAHTFAQKTPGILDESGHLKPAVLEARARGVRFDLSHGNGNFSFSVAERALAQGFLPDAISSDIHVRSKERVGSLALVMSKLMACGADLWTVLELVTGKAAAMLNLPEDCTVRVGREANLTLFELHEGAYSFTDSDGVPKMGACLIAPKGAVLGEQVYL